MSDETCAVPTSADIEVICQRLAAAVAVSPLGSVVVGSLDLSHLLSALDGERRHRADLEAENAKLRAANARASEALGAACDEAQQFASGRADLEREWLGRFAELLDAYVDACWQGAGVEPLPTP